MRPLLLFVGLVGTSNSCDFSHIPCLAGGSRITKKGSRITKKKKRDKRCILLGYSSTGKEDKNTT